ncbi:MAG TPA: type II secretion system F family protein [Gammaproteobacteria bacterium]|nr:type II secretion system F family protein [Gammaproteobacteria bacterium]
MKDKDVLNLFRQLATLLSGGVSLAKSFEICIQTFKHPALLQVKSNLEAGVSFFNCLQKYPAFFDTLICRFIQIGEHTGTLDLMLNKIVDYLEDQQKLSQQIKQVLFYPLIICLTATACLLFMLLYIVPHFAALFSQLPQKLPMITQQVISLSAGLCRHQNMIFALLISSGSIVYFKAYNIKKWCLNFLPYLPIASKLYKKILLARCTQYLALCLKAAIPLSDSILLTAKLFSTPISSILYRLYSAIQSGNRLHTALAYNSFFPSLLIHMVKTGEESGTLDIMLSKFTTIYENDIAQDISFFNQALEPLIIAILGVLIGGILIAMYLPIFQLGTAL